MRERIFEWAVIGAGPAGIAAVGKLLDSGIAAEQILWVDPAFKVGDFGALWSNVSSNTKVKTFTSFLYALHSFNYAESADRFTLSTLDPENTCVLHAMVEPLQWISDHLCQRVTTKLATIEQMSLHKDIWCLSTRSHAFNAYNVILATGALPSSLHYPEKEIIPFNSSIDKDKLAQAIHPDDTYAVFGSSHSAIIIVRHLVELGVKRIINFYRTPCRYAVEMDGWILFDNTGLKGQTALWAREYIDGVAPANLERYKVSESYIAQYLPQCSKVIYAIGFEQRKSIAISHYDEVEHDPHMGTIGPGLFGFGIAYPELKTDPLGNVESQVGLWKFMNYLNRVMPVWLKQPSAVH